MEVHQHVHTARKKWSHYFWEFIMLFLAVFCGFLAENQREHMIEHKREKQFAVSLINDLRLDIAWLDTVSNSARKRIQNLDAALQTLVNRNSTAIPVTIYNYLRNAEIQIMFFPNDGTMTQLKSSGGLRLIRKRAVVDSIENYDRLMRRLETRRSITNEKRHDYIEVLNKVVDGSDLLHSLYDSLFYAQKPTIQTIRLNSQYKNELINQCISLRRR